MQNQDKYESFYPAQQPATVGSGGGPETVTRPRPAAVSCSHFWAFVLLLAGITEVVIGALLFSEWQNIGSFWAGAVAISAGIAGACVTGSRPKGGASTGIFMLLSILTVAAATSSLLLGDGSVYLIIRSSDGNCFDASACDFDECADHDCVCWEPDGTSQCDASGNTRYCFTYGSDPCEDVGDSEPLLLGSSICLLIIDVFALVSAIVAYRTCCRCQRYIVERPTQS